ncbi:MAG: DUF1104 domain-containing protein [Sulfurimonas sp.]|nr:DUF1104 domain-containing protein [Sulfurimonas sp.]
MTKIIISLFLTLFLNSFLYAGENYSEMSTQELISIIGYVKKDESDTFKKELESRVASMSASEKESYVKNLHKLK